MNRFIHVAALAVLAVLGTMAGCAQKDAEPALSPDATATTAPEDEHSEAAGEHADESEAPLSMTAAEQASAGLRIETLAPMRLG